MNNEQTKRHAMTMITILVIYSVTLVCATAVAVAYLSH